MTQNLIQVYMEGNNHHALLCEFLLVRVKLQLLCISSRPRMGLRRAKLVIPWFFHHLLDMDPSHPSTTCGKTPRARRSALHLLLLVCQLMVQSGWQSVVQPSSFFSITRVSRDKTAQKQALKDLCYHHIGNKTYHKSIIFIHPIVGIVLSGSIHNVPTEVSRLPERYQIVQSIKQSTLPRPILPSCLTSFIASENPCPASYSLSPPAPRC